MKELFKYEKANLREKLDMKTLRYPISVYLKITTNCMLNCEFCSQYGKKVEELDIDLAKKVLKELQKLGISNIFYTGGEPLMYKKLEELLLYGYSLGFKQILVTNGYLLSDKKIRNLMKYIVSIGISLHGTPKIHNELSKVNCFEKIISNLKQVQEENPNLRINVNCTAIEKNTNYENLKFLAILCQKNDWELSIARLNYIGNGKKYENIDLNNMLNIITKLNEEGFKIKISNCIAPCLVDEKYQYLSHGCGAGQSIAAIEANGEVKICASSNYILGNIKEKSFKTIWNCKENKIYRKLKWLPPECRVCKNFVTCKGGCKAELSGEFWKKFCDDLVSSRFEKIWNKIEENKLVLNFKNIRRESYNRYTTISVPSRICNKKTIEVLQMIDGNTTAREIIKKNPRYMEETKKLLIALKDDNLIDIIK